MNANRSGILAGGNFIVDRVKMVDHFPKEEMLATILSESVSNGGGPYNLLKDLARMKAGFPLSAVGLVGDDTEGGSIVEDCRRVGINVDQLSRTNAQPTSYTDAMTVVDTGKRTFFHHRGTNALLDVGHFDFAKTNARLFYLGYLMLLDQLDKRESGRSCASLVLQSAQEAGLETCVDMVSIDAADFEMVAKAAFRWTDHLIINETEAGRTIGANVTAADPDALLNAAKELLASGVRQTVTIHSRFGAVSCCTTGDSYVQPALALDERFPIRGSNGAGDAFAAGYLIGLHQLQPLAERLLLAVCAAAMSLTDPTPSDGLQPVADCLKLASEYPPGSFGG